MNEPDEYVAEHERHLADTQATWVNEPQPAPKNETPHEYVAGGTSAEGYAVCAVCGESNAAAAIHNPQPAQGDGERRWSAWTEEYGQREFTRWTEPRQETGRQWQHLNADYLNALEERNRELGVELAYYVNEPSHDSLRRRAEAAEEHNRELEAENQALLKTVADAKKPIGWFVWRQKAIELEAEAARWRALAEQVKSAVEIAAMTGCDMLPERAKAWLADYEEAVTNDGR